MKRYVVFVMFNILTCHIDRTCLAQRAMCCRITYNASSVICRTKEQYPSLRLFLESTFVIIFLSRASSFVTSFPNSKQKIYATGSDPEAYHTIICNQSDYLFHTQQKELFFLAVMRVIKNLYTIPEQECWNTYSCNMYMKPSNKKLKCPHHSKED